MADIGHERTNDIIDELTGKIEKEYEAAAKAVEKKLSDYLKGFEKKEEEQLILLDEGKITEQQFNTWRQTQLLTGERWQDLLEQLAGDMVNANEIARSTIREHMADVYTLNRNYAAYQIEWDSKIDTSWTLYNRRATEFLFQNNENMLPMPKPGGKAWQAMMDKDRRWNQQKINSSMIQGILQGDGIRELSGRLGRVVGMNETSAVRSARTMTTYVQNRGRQDTYDELAEKGLELEETWVATLDDRTRSSHRWLHGEQRSENGTYSNGLQFPGDPMGEPEEVYNCRCTQRATVKGHGFGVPKDSPKMTKDFDEWLGEKPERYTETPEEPTAPTTPHEAIEQAKDYDELNDALAHGYGMYLTASCENLEFEWVREAVSGITYIVDEFPQAAELFSKIETSKSGIMACSPDGTIKFNPHYFLPDGQIHRLQNVVQSMKSCEDSHFHPPNSGIFGCGAHEAGHVLERMLIRKAYADEEYSYYVHTMEINEWNKCTQAKRIIHEACKRAKKTPEGKGMKVADLKRAVSGYAMENESECLAECVCDYASNADGASLLSRIVWGMLKEELG